MKKIFSIFAALTLSAGLWAEAPANVESVDLGLPSGLKWATFNVGATAPEGNGDYFAWGETEPYYNTPIANPLIWEDGKTNGYNWQSYCGASDFTEWSTAPYDATTKNLKSEFDAATANWGSDWRMPTKAEQDELRAECIWTWTEDYNGTGIKGYIVTSKAEGNTNSIFLPISGFYSDLSLDDVDVYGNYWSSSLYEDGSEFAYFLIIYSDEWDWGYGSRCNGQPVRPVTTKSIVPGPKVGEQFVDEDSGLKYEVTAVGEANSVKVIKNDYSGTTYTVPAKVSYNGVEFTVTKIGDNAFEWCSSLESVTIPESVTTIGELAFYYCSSLQSVTLSEGLLTIGVEAFEECSSLESITIPASVTTIGEYAFLSCVSLQSITIPASVTTIGKYAFQSCESLQSVTLSEGLLTIEEGAFTTSGLISITIPASVTEIGPIAFVECTGLTSVTFLGNACQDAIFEDAFSGVGADAPALLTLPDNWTGTKPDKEGNWYEGKFKLNDTALPQTRVAVKATKVMTNGQVIFRAENKNFSVLGQEVR